MEKFMEEHPLLSFILLPTLVIALAGCFMAVAIFMIRLGLS